MTVRELRDKYLRFFQSKGHDIFPSGSLVPYDVTGRLDESLLFNGAGMVQFKPFFRGVAVPPNRRLTTAQKCVRTGDIESVGDLTHLTFFEMLGNFSFGDYFKAQAIDFSWEFLTSTEWLGLDPRRLAFTVFEEDDEAFASWEIWVRSAGMDPASRIFRLGEETNYWPAGAFSSGPPGPCGPNSEMFYWTSDEEPPGADYRREDYLRDEADGKWLEIWNDVFIQYEWQGRLKDAQRPQEGYAKEGMPPLPFASVDTGMGLERTAAVLGGFKSVYDTDAFAPILRTLADLSATGGDEADRARRIIADHIRTACFCIADGILPGNAGRGYVLRRLIRRAVLKGQRVLGFDRPFFHLVYDGVVAALGNHYTELVERRDVIVETLQNEEALFRRTIASGSAMLQEELTILAKAPAADGRGHVTLDLKENVILQDRARPVLSGESAFRLYDTFGFPLEVTQELAEEAGVEVDIDGYDKAMREAQERSRASSGMESVYGGVTVQFTLLVQGEEDRSSGTRFLGYDTCRAPARIVGAEPQLRESGNASREFVVALDQTPFYAESGGQISDVGEIRGDDFVLKVVDLVKQDGIVVHMVEPAGGTGLKIEGLEPDAARARLLERLMNQPVEAVIDEQRRSRILRNHTATHLMHAALRQVLGGHVTQAGSYVGPDRLRFDFTHGRAMTPEELAEVERVVNERALENAPVVTYADLPIAEAKAKGAMALFGEKYGDRVRMVEVGTFSRELCGGTHVRSTGEIGLFKIVSEGSAASGVRRIEALTGEAAYEWVLEETRRIRDAASLLKAGPKDLVRAVERLQEQIRDLNRKLEKARSQGANAAQAQVETVGSVELAVQKLEEGDARDASHAADRLAEDAPNRVVLVGLSADGKVSFVCKVGVEAQARGAHAGNLIREVARVAGGGGGGRPDFATAGGKLPEKVDEALAAAPSIVAGMVGA
jgi:alanyl-tRNA synthetase